MTTTIKAIKLLIAQTQAVIDMANEELKTDPHPKVGSMVKHRKEAYERSLEGLNELLKVAEGEGKELQAIELLPHARKSVCPACGSLNNSELAKNDRFCYDCKHSWQTCR